MAYFPRHTHSSCVVPNYNITGTGTGVPVGQGVYQSIVWPSSTQFQQTQTGVNVVVQLMDASGHLIAFEIDPSILNLITLINTAHSAKFGIPPIYNPVPNNLAQKQPKSFPEEDFTLDELAKAEELMEELGAH